MTFERCPGCGVTAPTGDGSIHPYLEASPGCWAIHGEVLAREYQQYALPPIHRLTVDTYAAQHPGGVSAPAPHAVAIHLAGLHLVLERELDFARTTDVIVALLCANQSSLLLDPPTFRGELTIRHVLAATNRDQHVDFVQRWAASTWAAWSVHHATIRSWVDEGAGYRMSDVGRGESSDLSLQFSVNP